MLDLMERNDHYHREQLRLERETAEPSWLQPLRSHALTRFQKLPWPTTKDEAWHFTNLKTLTGAKFHMPRTARTTAAGEAASRFFMEDALRLVFVDGFFVPELSIDGPLPKGLNLLPLHRATDEEAQAFGHHFSLEAVDGADVFTSMNTAFLHQGVLVETAPGTTVEKPIHLLYLGSGGTHTVTHPRTVVAAGANSSLTLVESHASESDHEGWTNSVTDIRAARGARIAHYFSENLSEHASHTANLRIEQERGSAVETHHLLVGGGLVRNNITVALNGSGAETTVNGLLVGHGTQHLDNHIFVDHTVPNCRSRQYFKGILDDRARGVFTGRVVVRQDAQKTDAEQTNRNLLLSEQARVDAMPQLEIYADDVKCAHGATTGQLDRDALFYLMTRGIERDRAVDLLLFGFAHEIIERMPLAAFREQAERLLFQRFSRASL